MTSTLANHNHGASSVADPDLDQFPHKLRRLNQRYDHYVRLPDCLESFATAEQDDDARNNLCTLAADLWTSAFEPWFRERRSRSRIPMDNSFSPVQTFREADERLIFDVALWASVDVQSPRTVGEQVADQLRAMATFLIGQADVAEQKGKGAAAAKKEVEVA
jgi:hypothetical protein